MILFKNKIRLSEFLSHTLFCFCVFILNLPVISSATDWKAGVASVDVTPQKPEWMAGYSNRDKPSEGIISRLYVKALALEDRDGTKVVIVTADLIGNLRELSNRVAQTIGEQYSVPRSAIIFNASHTHCGPEIRSDSPPLYLPDKALEQIKEYTNRLEKQYVSVIGSAIENLQPAQLTFSSVKPTPFAVSRRFPTPEGIVYRSGPSSYYTGGPRDDIVPVLKVSASDGTLKAILFGYACHPITLNEMKFCGDYPGYAQQYIEEAFPGTTAMFMQGCAGQLVPNARFQIEYAIGHGRSLADAVKKALDGEQKEITGTLSSDYEEVALEQEPLQDRQTLEEHFKSDNKAASRRAAFFLKKLDNNETVSTTFLCPLQAMCIGNELLMIGLSGEPVVDYAVRFKAEFSSQFTWVSGYNNHVLGYIPTLKIQKEGGYEGGGAMRYMPYSGPFTDTVEQRVVDGVRRLVKNVKK